MILAEAARSSHYSSAEIALLDWEQDVPDISELSRVWKAAVDEARALCALLPLEHVGECILDSAGEPS